MGDEIEITRKESSPKHCKCGRVKFNLVMCSRCYDKVAHPQKVLEGVRKSFVRVGRFRSEY
jgi:hypothetical protein